MASIACSASHRVLIYHPRLLSRKLVEAQLKRRQKAPVDVVGPARAMEPFTMMNGRLRLSSTRASTLIPPNTSISSSGRATAPGTTHGSRRATSPTAWISFVNLMLGPSQKPQKTTIAACQEQNHRAAGNPEAEPVGTLSSCFLRRRRKSVRYRGQQGMGLA